jgi:hypothetical protein
MIEDAQSEELYLDFKRSADKALVVSFTTTTGRT